MAAPSAIIKPHLSNKQSPIELKFELGNLLWTNGVDTRLVRDLRTWHYKVSGTNLPLQKDLAERLVAADARSSSVENLLSHLTDGVPLHLTEDLLQASLKVTDVEQDLRSLQEDARHAALQYKDASIAVKGLEILICAIKDKRIYVRGSLQGVMLSTLGTSYERHKALLPVLSNYSIEHATPASAQHKRESLQNKVKCMRTLQACLLGVEGCCSLAAGCVQMSSLRRPGDHQLATCGSWLGFVAACLTVIQGILLWLAWRIRPLRLGTPCQHKLELADDREKHTKAKELLGKTALTDQDLADCNELLGFFGQRISKIQGHPDNEVPVHDVLAMEKAAKDSRPFWVLALGCKGALEGWAAEIPWSGPSASWPQASVNLLSGAVSLLCGLYLSCRGAKPPVKDCHSH